MLLLGKGCQELLSESKTASDITVLGQTWLVSATNIITVASHLFRLAQGQVNGCALCCVIR